jgi:hypothetical protein
MFTDYSRMSVGRQEGLGVRQDGGVRVGAKTLLGTPMEMLADIVRISD